MQHRPGSAAPSVVGVLCTRPEHPCVQPGTITQERSVSHLIIFFLSQDFLVAVMKQLKQDGQRCPKRRVAQAAIRLATAVIKFRNKGRNVRSPS